MITRFRFVEGPTWCGTRDRSEISARRPKTPPANGRLPKKRARRNIRLAGCARWATDRHSQCSATCHSMGGTPMHHTASRHWYTFRAVSRVYPAAPTCRPTEPARPLTGMHLPAHGGPEPFHGID